MKEPKLNAVTLRMVLIVLLLIIVGLSVGGFYFAQDWLNSLEVSSNINTPKVTTNNTGNVALTPVQQIAADKAANFLASAQDYQNQITQDLNKYASDTGIVIENISPGPGTNAPQPGGIKSSLLTITLTNPVDYTNLIKFIKAIETNIPKMKFQGVSVNQSKGSSGTVTVEPLIVEVYTR